MSDANEMKALSPEEEQELKEYIDKNPLTYNPIIRRKDDATIWKKFDNEYAFAKKCLRSICDEMFEIAFETKMFLYGIENALKSPESFERKVFEQRISKNDLKSIDDIVRFTFLHDSIEGVQQIKKCINLLEQDGYQIRKIENKWLNSEPFNGVNIDVKFPVVNIETPNGLVFEIQFQTEHNVEVKEDMHVYYEYERLQSTPDHIKELCRRKEYQIGKGWERPNNIEEIKNYDSEIRGSKSKSSK